MSQEKHGTIASPSLAQAEVGVCGSQIYEVGQNKSENQNNGSAPDGAAVPVLPEASVPLGPNGLPIQMDRRTNLEPYSGPDRRKAASERRASVDRRVVDIGSPTGLERRRGPGCRRTNDRKSAEEGEMTDEQFEFVLAIDTYKRLNGRPFPSWTEVLEIVKQLGYRKVAASSIHLANSTGRSNVLPAPTPPAPPEKESDYMPG